MTHHSSLITQHSSLSAQHSSLSTHLSALSTHHSCDYCGLIFTGKGYSPDDERRFCCYGCYLVQQIIGSQGGDGVAAWITLRLGVGAFLSMNVMMISIILYTQSPGALGASAIHAMRWAMLALSTPAMIILGFSFLVAAARELRYGRISTDALIVTGSFAAFFVSAANVLYGSGHVYFDTATMLLFIVTLGRLLEAISKNRTSKAIREMIELTPDMARVLRDGREEDISSQDVRIGDLLIVKPGERIPADGLIISGSCLVEESSFTGESRPRSCSPGDRVYGSSVNCDGYITVEAAAVGADSMVEQIRKMVLQAQENYAPIERLAGRVASVFVPLVWLLSAGAAVYWGGIIGNWERAGLCALAVLVVSCPCALGLATPMATCLAIGKAAHSGVLIRSGEILERLPAIKRIFFDKTGSLTDNRLTIAKVMLASDDITADEAIAWAAAVEAGSEHAIANAIVAEARALGLPIGNVTGFRAIPGQGVIGTVAINGETKQVAVGSLKLLSEGHSAPESFTVAEESDPLSVIYIGWDGAVKAAISLQDSIRPEAIAAIELLTAAGVKPAVLSGDLKGPTYRLARELNIDDVFAECAPDEKAAVVKKARESNGTAVAMVGDGINDAAALAEASVGIAIGGGSDLARESSDVILLGDDLSRIPWVLDLSKLTYRIIKQNLWWAFGYNSIAVALAFFGFVHPLIAATAMFISSLCVIANSTRLLR
ncbi:MAG: cation-translocating P-type ATPase [Armatimonadota bacterium]|nr:cation-translocating P-type ATPase [Armatimonadota bacterium]